MSKLLLHHGIVYYGGRPWTGLLGAGVTLGLAFMSKGPVAFVQTLVFTLLSMIYISEVSHAPHEHVHGGEHSPKTGAAIATAHV